jgi:hypothetical protein
VPLTHWVGRGTETPKDKDEVNKREVCETRGMFGVNVVYYESIKREPKIRGIYECRCDERLQTKTKEFTRLPYTMFYYFFFLGKQP